METVVLSYDELAERLRINPHSARNLVRRKRWKRTVGNDGKARVTVPMEALAAPSAPLGGPAGNSSPITNPP